jgi:hypothetical protein
MPAAGRSYDPYSREMQLDPYPAHRWLHDRASYVYSASMGSARRSA